MKIGRKIDAHGGQNGPFAIWKIVFQQGDISINRNHLFRWLVAGPKPRKLCPTIIFAWQSQVLRRRRHYSGNDRKHGKKHNSKLNRVRGHLFVFMLFRLVATRKQIWKKVPTWGFESLKCEGITKGKKGDLCSLRGTIFCHGYCIYEVILFSAVIFFRSSKIWTK